MDPYTQLVDKILTIIVTLIERDKLILEALPEDKRADVALAQYADQKAWRDFWQDLFKIFKKP